jgi:hypothetical protein
VTQLPVLAGSLAAILVLAGFARLLGLGGGGLASAEQARDTAEAMLSGFEGGEVLLGSDGKSALVQGRANDAALLKLHGARIAARHLAQPLATERTPDGLRIDSRDRRFGTVLLRGVTHY